MPASPTLHSGGAGETVKENGYGESGERGRAPGAPDAHPVPIALWIFSLVADVIYLWRGSPVWRDYIAFYALLAGIIGAVFAAVPGLVDWLSITDRGVKKIADWHARLNVIALVIFAVDFYLRTSGACAGSAGAARSRSCSRCSA